MLKALVLSAYKPLYTPSRLKGIETKRKTPDRPERVHFVYTFPFEGNWNTGLSVSNGVGKIVFVYTFPFEGNWNRKYPRGTRLSVYDERISLYPPSRLKGIETQRDLESHDPPQDLCIHLPVWRELKHCHLTSHTGVSGKVFVSTFPFEGNWNTISMSITNNSLQRLCIHLPVWRELKHY